MPTSFTRISDAALANLVGANSAERSSAKANEVRPSSRIFLKASVRRLETAPTVCISLPQRSGERGFTLLELLVVVVMVAILMGTVVLGFTGADTEQRLKGTAEQLAYTIEMARQYALQRNREWGLYVDPDAIEFVEFDPEQQTWVEHAERPFGAAEIMENVELRVESEGFDQLADEDQEDLPHVILFSSGEVTPFTVFMVPMWDVPGWEISSDGISRVRAQRAEY